MQRRPSHPHGQLTGLIVIVSLMVSVAVMFWLPSQAQHTPALAAAGEAPTPALPSAADITRTPRIEQGPEANGGAPVPTMDWASVPTAVPAEQLIQPTTAPEVVYVAGPVQTVYVPGETVYVAVEAPAGGGSPAPAEALAPIGELHCPCDVLPPFDPAAYQPMTEAEKAYSRARTR